jgi:hypothetical protein
MSVFRSWLLVVHLQQNLLAAGRDMLSGERFYVKNRYLRVHEFHNARDVPLVSLRRTTSSARPGIGGGPRTLTYNVINKAENNVLIASDAVFELERKSSYVKPRRMRWHMDGRVQRRLFSTDRCQNLLISCSQYLILIRVFPN